VSFNNWRLLAAAFVRAGRHASGCGEPQILKIPATPLGDWIAWQRGRLRASASAIGVYPGLFNALYRMSLRTLI
jgi:hypothetical protein